MNMKQLIFGGGVKNAGSVQGVYAGSVQDWLPIKNIIGGVIIAKDNRFIKVLEVLPINFYLKPAADQQAIIASYAGYQKIAPNSLQISVITQKSDMADYVARMKARIESEPVDGCREMIQDNMDEVLYLAANETINHRFFISFEYEPQMRAKKNTVRAIIERLNEEADVARRYLDVCGLEVLEPRYADNAMLELLYELINKRTSRRVKLPEGVFDMVGEVHGVYET